MRLIGHFCLFLLEEKTECKLKFWAKMSCTVIIRGAFFGPKFPWKVTCVWVFAQLLKLRNLRGQCTAWIRYFDVLKPNIFVSSLLWRGKTLIYIFQTACHFYHQVNLLIHPVNLLKDDSSYVNFYRAKFFHVCVVTSGSHQFFNPYSFSQKGKKLLKAASLTPLPWRCLGTLCTGRTGRRAPSTPATNGRERRGGRSCLPSTHPWTSRSWAPTDSPTVRPACPQTPAWLLLLWQGKCQSTKWSVCGFKVLHTCQGVGC